MTGVQTLIARGALGIAGSLAGIALVSMRRLRTLPDELFRTLAIGGLVVSRLGLFGLVFLILRLQVRGDIPGYYWPEAQAAIHGRLPYRDFVTSYAPLHAFLDAAAVQLWHSPLAIILIAIAAECALLPLWLSVGRRLFAEQELRTAALLYLANPMSLIFVCIDGQDNVVIALLLVASLALLLRRSAVIAGAAVAVSMAAIKILALLFTPIFFFATPRRWSWAAGFVSISAIVYGAAVALHLPIAQPLTNESALRTAGNLPYLLEAGTGHLLLPRLLDAVVLVALCATLLFVARAVRDQPEGTRLRVITFAMPALILVLVIFSKKGWPNYLMLVLFPLCLLARRLGRAGLGLFSAFSAIAVVEHSYWASLFSQIDSPGLHRLLIVGHPAPGELLLLGHLLLESLLIAGYGWLLALALGEIALARHPAAATAEATIDR